MDFLATTLEAPANGPRTDLWAAFFGLATWLAFVGAVVGLALAIALWKRHVLARVIGFAVVSLIAWSAIGDAVDMVATAPESLAAEIRGRAIVGSIALVAAILVGASLAISAVPLVESIRVRWNERVSLRGAD